MKEHEFIEKVRQLVSERGVDRYEINLIIDEYILLNDQSYTRIQRITIDSCAEIFGLKFNNLIERNDNGKLKADKDRVLARQFVWYYLKGKYKVTYTNLGKLFGGMHHANVMHGIDKVGDLIKFNKDVRFQWNEINRIIEEKKQVILS